MVAAQVVEHVVHVDGLVDRPGRPLLAVGEVRVRQIDLDVLARAAMPPRQPQRVPQIGPEQLVDRRLRDAELCPARQVVRPERQRLRRGPPRKTRPASFSRASEATTGEGSLMTNSREPFAATVEMKSMTCQVLAFGLLVRVPVAYSIRGSRRLQPRALDREKDIVRATVLKEECISPALGCELQLRGFGQVSLMVDLDGDLSRPSRRDS